jgi:stage V sporulation protein R
MKRLADILSEFLPQAYEAMAAWGVDPVPIDFEIVPADVIYQMASYGLPGHYSHWTYGRDYWRMKQQFEAGAGRLYEMMVDTEPPIAYLLESNSIAAQKLVVAHCLGHADLFRHHVLAQQGSKTFHESLAAASERFDQYRQQYGISAVEAVLDDALSLQAQVADEPDAVAPESWSPTTADPYRELWANRPRPLREAAPRYRLPTADLLGFLARHGSIEDWQRDILWIVRLEGLYYQPRRQIKVIHEGWATFCHQKLLAELPLSAGEQIEAARVHAEVAWPHPLSINPYWFGWQLIQLLVQDWGLLPARSILCQETDASLVRNYLRPSYVTALDLFQYHWTEGFVITPQGPQAVYEAQRQALDGDVLRHNLANQLAERPPEIVVQEVDHDDRLILMHPDDGTRLDRKWAELTLAAVRRLWGHPVVLYDANWVCQA